MGKHPIGYRPPTDPFAPALQNILLLQSIRGAAEDRQLRRARTLETLTKQEQDFQTKRAADVETLFTKQTEAATGGPPSADIEPLLAPARELTRPGAKVTAPIGGRVLPEGANILRRPATREDVAGQLALAAPKIKERTLAELEGLPVGPEREAIRGAITRGTIARPGLVVPEFGKRVKEAKEAVALETERVTQEPKIARTFAEAEKARADVEIAKSETQIKRTEAAYAQALKQADLEHKQALTQHSQLESQKVGREIGLVPVVPGSPQAIAVEKNIAETQAARALVQERGYQIQKLQLEMEGTRRARAAVDRFYQTGKIEDLNEAVLYSSNGAVNLANMIEKGREFDINTLKTVALATERTMASRTLLLEHVNKKGDLPTAQTYQNDINTQNRLIAHVTGSPNVQWQSVRQKEGIGGRLVNEPVTLPRDVADLLATGQARPAESRGLYALLAGNYGDLFNRLKGGDAAAFNQLMGLADTYPGATRDSSETVKQALQTIFNESGKAPAIPTADGLQAPRVEENVPPEYKAIEQRDVAASETRQREIARGRDFTVWLAEQARKVGKTPVQLTDQEIANYRRQWEAQSAGRSR